MPAGGRRALLANLVVFPEQLAARDGGHSAQRTSVRRGGPVRHWGGGEKGRVHRLEIVNPDTNRRPGPPLPTSHVRSPIERPVSPSEGRRRTDASQQSASPVRNRHDRAHAESFNHRLLHDNRLGVSGANASQGQHGDENQRMDRKRPAHGRISLKRRSNDYTPPHVASQVGSIQRLRLCQIPLVASRFASPNSIPAVPNGRWSKS